VQAIFKVEFDKRIMDQVSFVLMVIAAGVFLGGQYEKN
jgi:hypothetical protein